MKKIKKNDSDLIKEIENSPQGKSKIARLQEAIDTFAKRQTSKMFEVETPGKEEIVEFIAIGDTHLGSLYERIDVFRAAYGMAEKEGISFILHAGDIIDGHNIYRGQEFELHKHGWDAQFEWLKDNVPKSEVKTYFITGNHDSSFKKQAGIEPGKAFESEIENWSWLGSDIGEINFKNKKGNGFKVALLHPGGGSAYALSYRPQKIAEQWEGGKKPNMIINGHYHKAEFIPNYRNIALLQVGTCQAQTPFMVTKGLAAHIGFWKIQVFPARNYNRVKAEFIAVYK